MAKDSDLYLSKKQKKFFNLAKEVAETSDFDGIKIGCILVYKNTVIGRGANSKKTHPVQKEYNKYRNFNRGTGKMIVHSLHSETAALIDAEHNVNNEDIDWSKVHVYTYRIVPGLAFGKGCSLCCPACRHMLRDKGIKSIYYTEEYGYGHIILDE